RLGDALLRTGNQDSSLAAYRNAVIAAEQRAALDTTHGGAQSELAHAYAKLGEALYKTGLDSELSIPEKKQHLMAAHTSYAKSLSGWKDLQRKGVVIMLDAKEPQDVAAALAKCERALKSLGT